VLSKEDVKVIVEELFTDGVSDFRYHQNNVKARLICIDAHAQLPDREQKDVYGVQLIKRSRCIDGGHCY
jgi:hypothetical protein